MVEYFFLISDLLTNLNLDGKEWQKTKELSELLRRRLTKISFEFPEDSHLEVRYKSEPINPPGCRLSKLHSPIFFFRHLYIMFVYSNIRVVATTPRKDPQPNISDLRDHSQSIFRPILPGFKKKKKKKKKKVATPIY